jgi:hypothetical protein
MIGYAYVMVYGGVESQFHAFITLILDGGEVSFTPWMLYPWEKSTW